MAFVALGAQAAELRPGDVAIALASQAAPAWDERIDALLAAGRLAPLSSRPDPDFPGRFQFRYGQHEGGLRVYGAELVRHVDARGHSIALFGRLLDGLSGFETRPALSAADAVRAAIAGTGPGALASGAPELLLLPLADGNRLAFAVPVRRGLEAELVFVDAGSGSIALRLDEVRQATIGTGVGTWGDRKKLSVEEDGSGFRAADRLRPPALVTYDLRYDVNAWVEYFETGSLPGDFVARDGDNDWRDGAVVDAHVYAGWTYDYYFKRHGRRGIDDANLTVTSFVHLFPNVPGGIANAFWHGPTSTMFYGDGDGVYGSFAAAIDVVAHELTHGVSQFTWGGGGGREASALGESFSDIMGTSAEFYFESPGDGRQRADYWLGEDVGPAFDPLAYAARSMAEPGLFCRPVAGCDPDHMSRLYRGNLDGGGVHMNAGIPNHAFYLLVEGGTHRTSGITVPGLGAANRTRAERIFYRGFTSYLTRGATFADARAATIQAARDLYGEGEATQTALAWTAVGVP